MVSAAESIRRALAPDVAALAREALALMADTA
jgi:hypothetical protein